MPHAPVAPRNRQNAKSMRRVMTDAELRLWNELRAHRLMNLGFRRQFPIGPYIVDFACSAKKLVVEVDGTQHADPASSAADEARSRRLAEDGWTVLRFWNDDVIRDLDGVCLQIVTAAGLAEADAAALAERRASDPTRPLRGHPPLEGEGRAGPSRATMEENLS